MKGIGNLHNLSMISLGYLNDSVFLLVGILIKNDKSQHF